MSWFLIIWLCKKNFQEKERKRKEDKGKQNRFLFCPALKTRRKRRGGGGGGGGGGGLPGWFAVLCFVLNKSLRFFTLYNHNSSEF